MKKLEIKITQDKDGDHVFIDANGTINDLLGMIARVRFELTSVEQRAFAELEKPPHKQNKKLTK